MYNLINQHVEYAWIVEVYIITQLQLGFNSWKCNFKRWQNNTSFPSLWYFQSQEPNASKVWQIVTQIKPIKPLAVLLSGIILLRGLDKQFWKYRNPSCLLVNWYFNKWLYITSHLWSHWLKGDICTICI
jgi:hypothetical protein